MLCIFGTASGWSVQTSSCPAGVESHVGFTVLSSELRCVCFPAL